MLAKKIISSLHTEAQTYIEEVFNNYYQLSNSTLYPTIIMQSLFLIVGVWFGNSKYIYIYVCVMCMYIT